MAVNSSQLEPLHRRADDREIEAAHDAVTLIARRQARGPPSRSVSPPPELRTRATIQPREMQTRSSRHRSADNGLRHLKHLVV